MTGRSGYISTTAISATVGLQHHLQHYFQIMNEVGDWAHKSTFFPWPPHLERATSHSKNVQALYDICREWKRGCTNMSGSALLVSIILNPNI